MSTWHCLAQKVKPFLHSVKIIKLLTKQEKSKIITFAYFDKLCVTHLTCEYTQLPPTPFSFIISVGALIYN